MSRMYIVNHWSDAAAYSGEQIGDRLKDSSALHFKRDGSANVELYSEEYAAKKKASSVSIKDKILPQFKRLTVLQSQMLELEQSYKAGGMPISEYSLLRDLIVAKIQRQEVLLKRASSVKPTRTDDDYPEESLYTSNETPHYGRDSTLETNEHPQGDSSIWVDQLPDSNSLKLPIKKACAFIKTAVRLSQAAKNYYLTLKAL